MNLFEKREGERGPVDPSIGRSTGRRTARRWGSLRGDALTEQFVGEAEAIDDRAAPCDALLHHRLNCDLVLALQSLEHLLIGETREANLVKDNLVEAAVLPRRAVDRDGIFGGPHHRFRAEVQEVRQREPDPACEASGFDDVHGGLHVSAREDFHGESALDRDAASRWVAIDPVTLTAAQPEAGVRVRTLEVNLSIGADPYIATERSHGVEVAVNFAPHLLTSRGFLGGQRVVLQCSRDVSPLRGHELEGDLVVGFACPEERETHLIELSAVGHVVPTEAHFHPRRPVVWLVELWPFGLELWVRGRHGIREVPAILIRDSLSDHRDFGHQLRPSALTEGSELVAGLHVLGQLGVLMELPEKVLLRLRMDPVIGHIDDPEVSESVDHGLDLLVFLARITTVQETEVDDRDAIFRQLHDRLLSIWWCPFGALL